MSEDSESRPCLVCSAPTASVHFGMDVCSACSSFFKRAQLSGRRYLCRRGDHKCDVIRADDLMVCRGCRLDKCVAVGITYDQPLRRFYPKYKNRDSNLSSTVNEDSLLDRIAKEHAKWVERRRMQELVLIKRHNLARLPHLSEELYKANFDFAIATFNVTLAESWPVFFSVFPSVQALPYEDQRELFRVCIPHFALVDCFYRTKRIWGGFSGYTMCSVLGCHNLQKPEIWMGPQENGPMREELRETISGYLDDQLTMVVPLFEKAGICEREMHALLALLLCEADLQDDFAERFHPFLDGIRVQIIADLRRLYTDEMRLSEYSTRLGTLLTLCHTFQEANTAFQEFFRMQVTVFDLYSMEALLNDLLL